MKTLILFRGKHGTTESCAKLLKENLNGEVDMVNLKENSSLALQDYENVIIGSSVYMGKVHKEVKKFIEDNLNDLKDKRIGLFICCMNEKDWKTQLENNFPKELIDKALYIENFGGELKVSDMNFFEKGILKMAVKALSKNDEHLKNMDMKSEISMVKKDKIKKFGKKFNML